MAITNDVMWEPVRILHIMGKAQYGGVESVVYNYYRAIDHSKVQFDLVIDDDSPADIPSDITALGCRVYRTPSYTRFPAYLRAIEEICKVGAYKIVHSHMNTLSVFPLYAAWRAGVPVRIAHNHSTAGGGKDMTRDAIKCILRPFAKIFPTQYFACGEYAGRWLFGNRTFNQGRVTVINNAIDTKRFAFNELRRQEVRWKLGLEGKFVVGHIGRFSPPKNHAFLIKIFSEIVKTRPDSALLLIGGLGPGGVRIEREVKCFVQESGLENRVLFLGAQEDVSGYYQAMDVFVLPSLYEGLGMVSIEAQCSNLPCILSDCVPTEAKVNENTCFLSLYVTPQTWASAILKADRERFDQSKAIAEAGYEIREEAEKLTELYLALAFGSGAAIGRESF